MSLFRIICTVFLVISACAFPLFFTVGVGLFAVIWFKGYYEIIPISFVSDVVYGAPLERFHSFPYVMTLAAAIMVAVVMIVRKQMFDNTMQRI